MMMTPFSMLYGSKERFDRMEQDYIDSYSIQVLDFNNYSNANNIQFSDFNANGQ